MEQIYSYQIVADYFIAVSNEAQDLITNLKLQKMVYYAQAWHLAMFAGQPLINEDFQAWIHGPVIPELYNDYKKYRYHPIIRDDLTPDALKGIVACFGPPALQLLTDIANEYLPLSAFNLEQLTHHEDPWKIARGGLQEDEVSNNIIKKEWMREYYSQFISK